MLAISLSPWHLVVATAASIALVVGWLIIDGELWDRPDDDSSPARERSRLYNASTLLTITAGVLICYLALYLLNVLWALFILDPAVMGGYLKKPIHYGDLFVLAWFVASAATVGGGWAAGLSRTRRSARRRTRSARRTDASGWRVRDSMPFGADQRSAPRGGAAGANVASATTNGHASHRLVEQALRLAG